MPEKADRSKDLGELIESRGLLIFPGGLLANLFDEQKLIVRIKSVRNMIASAFYVCFLIFKRNVAPNPVKELGE